MKLIGEALPLKRKYIRDKDDATEVKDKDLAKKAWWVEKASLSFKYFFFDFLIVEFLYILIGYKIMWNTTLKLLA